MDAHLAVLSLIKVVLLTWQLAAYCGAALVCIRVFNHLKAETVPRPFCTVAAVTRCVLKRPPAGEPVNAIDMARLGSALLGLAMLAMAGNTLIYMIDLDLPSGSAYRDLLRGSAHVIVGSGVMICMAGVERLILEGAINDD